MRGPPRDLVSASAILVSAVVFLVPFAFIVIQAQGRRESSDRSSRSRRPRIPRQSGRVLSTRDYMLVTAFINSIS